MPGSSPGRCGLPAIRCGQSPLLLVPYAAVCARWGREGVPSVRALALLLKSYPGWQTPRAKDTSGSTPASSHSDSQQRRWQHWLKCAHFLVLGEQRVKLSSAWAGAQGRV